jgi:hypothetical protein
MITLKKAVSVFTLSTLLHLTLVLLATGCASSPKTETLAAPEQAQTPAAEASTPAAARTDMTNTTPPPKPPILCAKGADERVLEVAEKSPKCFLYYTKGKIKKRVAWSKNGNNHCESIRDQMRQTLEKSGYACRWQDAI